jgi:hypothetical protein
VDDIHESAEKASYREASSAARKIASDTSTERASEIDEGAAM